MTIPNYSYMTESQKGLVGAYLTTLHVLCLLKGKRYAYRYAIYSMVIDSYGWRYK